MKYKHLTSFALLAGLATSQAVSANTITIGTYSFDSTVVADELVSGSGEAYNGTTDYVATVDGWYQYGTENLLSAPNDATDQMVNTYIGTEDYYNGPLSLELGFSSALPVNNQGSDLVFFFLWDQTDNLATVTINGVDQKLDGLFTNVVNSAGDQQVATDVAWAGGTEGQVQLMSAEIDLSSFGFVDGAQLTDPFMITMQSTNANPMALAMVAALNTTDVSDITPVPVPAAVWLFASGLGVLAAMRRRKS